MRRGAAHALLREAGGRRGSYEAEGMAHALLREVGERRGFSCLSELRVSILFLEGRCTHIHHIFVARMVTIQKSNNTSPIEKV